jgi:hypothetical protein
MSKKYQKQAFANAASVALQSHEPMPQNKKPATPYDVEIGFEDLIAPVSKEEFFAEYWEKKPLVTRGRSKDFFAPLFSLQDVDRAICYFRPVPGRLDLVTEQGFVRDNFLNTDGTANIKLVREIFLKGSTIILNGMEETWEPLSLFALGLEGYLNHPVAISVYVTPPRFQGVNPHFDTQENFLLQVEGSKLWKVYEPVQEFPRVEGSYTRVPKEKLGEPICETVLEAGDMLYIPRGFVHEGIAGDSVSLHITVDVLVRTWHDFLLDALAGIAERNPQFRRSLPVGFLQDERAMQALEAEFTGLLEHLGQSVSLKDAVGKHTEMLAVKKTAPPDGHFSVLFAEILPDTLLKKRRTSLTRVFLDKGIAGMQFSGNQILGPAKIIDALHFIEQSESFTPASLPEPLSENEKLVLAKRMVLAGLLTLA